jgi:hypothetical protein
MIAIETAGWKDARTRAARVARIEVQSGRHSSEEAAEQNPRAMMKSLRITLLAAGIFAVLIGLVWVGQGTGYFPYPSSSFMIDQMPWAYRGAVVAVLGLIAVFVSRRIS